MSYVKTVWEDRYIETPNRYRMTDNGDGTVTLEEVTGTVYREGTSVNAPNMNKLEQGVYDVTEALPVNIITGQEVATNEYIDGSRVYVKRINIGTLPNATSKNVAHGLTNVTFVEITGIASSGNNVIILPLCERGNATQYNTSLKVIGENINIYNSQDQSSYTGYVTLKYIKNS